MKKGILWCPHCGEPHLLGARVCATTGKSLERGMHHLQQERLKSELEGKTIDGKYRVIRQIGRGGTSVVYEARQIALERIVAMKVLLASGSKENFVRLKNEAMIAARLQHPNICDVYDVGDLGERGPYLVMERLAGETLAARLRRQPRLPVPFAVDLVAQLLAGLQCAHGYRILHRDLKPQNVFIVDRLACAPICKLLDFGFAKGLASSANLTSPGLVCGTPHYMSPEQIRAQPLDDRSDLFAVGVILYEALAGIHPFRGKDAPEVRSSILHEQPRSLVDLRPDVPQGLADVVDRALAKDTVRRFRSAHAMRTALNASLPSGSSFKLSDDEPSSVGTGPIWRPAPMSTPPPS